MGRVVGALVLMGVIVAASDAAALAGGRCDGEGALVKANDGDPAVYYLLRGRRWLLPDEPVTWALGLSFNDVCELPPSELDAIPRGPNIGVNGALFLCPRCSNSAAVYRIESEARRHIANEHVLHDCLGLGDGDIFTEATPAFRDLYPPGRELEADCEPGDVEPDSCGACGRKLRTCESTCVWSAWSSCVGGDAGCEQVVAAATDVEPPPTACAGGGSRDGWPLAAALALGLVGALRRRRGRRGEF